MNAAWSIGILTLLGFTLGMLGPAAADRIRTGGHRKLREALDDVWGCVGAANIDDLQPKTVELARANHEKLWHAR